MTRHVITASLILALGCARQAGDTTRAAVLQAAPRVETVSEISGIARSGSRLLMVGDDTPDRYFVYDLTRAVVSPGTGPFLGEFPVDAAAVTAMSLTTRTSDLEGVATMDGITLMVSEAMSALVVSDRVVAQYPATLAPFGNRGLEGVAMRRHSDTSAMVAVLWEGGYPERGDLPRQLAIPAVLERSLRPVVCVHELPLSALGARAPMEPCSKAEDLVELDVPVAPDSLQGFRAPDLVWMPDGSGFLVLLSSQNATTAHRVEYKYKWLQRFDRSGHRAGAALNLCDILPFSVRSGRSGNVEGMTWFEEGRSVALINDTRGGATVVLVSVREQSDTTTPSSC